MLCVWKSIFVEFRFYFGNIKELIITSFCYTNTKIWQRWDWTHRNQTVGISIQVFVCCKKQIMMRNQIQWIWAWRRKGVSILFLLSDINIDDQLQISFAYYLISVQPQKIPWVNIYDCCDHFFSELFVYKFVRILKLVINDIHSWLYFLRSSFENPVFSFT